MMLYSVNVLDQKVVLTKNEDLSTFDVKVEKGLEQSLATLLEHYLNGNNSYVHKVHQNAGFIKCYTPYREYVMALKVCDVNDQHEADAFNHFFEQYPF